MSIFDAPAITERITDENRRSFFRSAARISVDRAQSGPSRVVIGSAVMRWPLVGARSRAVSRTIALVASAIRAVPGAIAAAAHRIAAVPRAICAVAPGDPLRRRATGPG
jgi:hypothetical protein